MMFARIERRKRGLEVSRNETHLQLTHVDYKLKRVETEGDIMCRISGKAIILRSEYLTIAFESNETKT